MSLFHRKPRVSKPTLVTHSGAPIKFQNTTIQIKHSGRNLPRGGHYQSTVLRHLEEISSFHVGKRFFNALTKFGKNQIILYGGDNSNQAVGSPMGYKLLRKYHDAMSFAQLADELKITMQKGNLDKVQLAGLLYNTPLPTWKGSEKPSPFRNLRTESSGGAQLRPQDRILPLIDGWLRGDGAGRLTNDQMDALMLALHQHCPDAINRGKGVGTRINYDPHKTQTAGQKRPPQVKLFHELIHAYYNAGGNQLGREDSAREENGGRLFELMAVGLGPFTDAEFSENELRKVWPGCPISKCYP